MNKVILIGRIGKDPEVRYSQDGKQITSFSMATSRKYNGEEKTQWHNIVAFGKLAEICGQYLNKGKQIMIDGEISYGQWEDKEGNKRYKTEIIAQSMEMLGGKQKDELSGQSAQDDDPF